MFEEHLEEEEEEEKKLKGEHLLLLDVSESCDVIRGIRGHAGHHTGAWGGATETL